MGRPEALSLSCPGSGLEEREDVGRQWLTAAGTHVTEEVTVSSTQPGPSTYSLQEGSTGRPWTAQILALNPGSATS